MAATSDFAVLVGALKDSLVGRLESTFLDDDQLAQAIRSAMAWMNGRLSAHCAFVPDALDDNNSATVESTVSPAIDPDGKWGNLLLTVARWRLATSGALVRGEENVGSYGGPAGSVRTGDKATQHRINAQAIMVGEIEPLVATLMGKHSFAVGETDYAVQYGID